MSFGFSVGDFLLVICMARTTYTNCLKAPREFHQAAQAVESLYVVLRAIEDEVDDPISPLRRDERRAKEFTVITKRCKLVLEQLDKIVLKYSSLGTDDTRLWHRIRFPNTEVGELRGKLSCYTSALSSFLGTVGLGALGRLEKAIDTAGSTSIHIQKTMMNAEQSQVRVEQKLNEAKDLRTQMNCKLDDATNERREILRAVHDLGSQFRAGARENSILSAHTDDSKYVQANYVMDYSLNFL
jgi:chromosome segregation ATPase